MSIIDKFREWLRWNPQKTAHNMEEFIATAGSAKPREIIVFDETSKNEETKIQEVKKMGFEYKNSRGQTYWLHAKGNLRFFSKQQEGSIDMPEGYEVAKECKRSGMPMIKKKA